MSLSGRSSTQVFSDVDPNYMNNAAANSFFRCVFMHKKMRAVLGFGFTHVELCAKASKQAAIRG